MPSIIDDILTVVFWSIAYLMIIYAGFRSIAIKKVSMPYIAGVTNIAWEICALYWTSGFWGYWLWVITDLFIVFFGFIFLDSVIKKISYLGSIVFCTIIFFLILDQSSYIFVLIAYVSDLCMSVLFLIESKKLSPILKAPIATAKLIGSFFAGFVFKEYTITVIIAPIVFVINSFYLYTCIKEQTKIS